MEIKNKLTLLALVIFTGCTSNPFWSDSPSKKINIQGYVFKQDSVSNVPVFVFIDHLGVSTNTDENGFYSIDLPNLEMEYGNFSGSVKIYYYIHNYKVFHSNLYITNGRLTSAQTDFDQNGALLSKSADDPDSILSDSQLEHRMRLESIYRSRILSLVTPIVGPGNVSAQVNLDIDFTRNETTEAAALR